MDTNLLLIGKTIIITPDDIYRALVSLESRKNKTASLQTLAGASEAGAKEEELSPSPVGIINPLGGGDLWER
jgi:hypothetical protein